MEVPMVTHDDLCRFASKHFLGAPLPSHLLLTAPVEDSYDEDDEDLGHYPDGVQRTLTEENIAYLRRKEIREVLEERRRLKAKAATPARSHGASDSEEAMQISPVQSDDSDDAEKTTKPAPTPSRSLCDGGKTIQSTSITRSCANKEGSRLAGSTNDDATNGKRKKIKSRHYSQKRREYRSNKQHRARRDKRRASKKARDENNDGANGGRTVVKADRPGPDDTDYVSETSESGESQESDEWTPRKQAKGPDNVQTTDVDLEYG